MPNQIRKLFKSKIFLPILILLIAVFFAFFYFKENTNGYLSFSDGAKFAITARAWVSNNESLHIFSFFGTGIFNTIRDKSILGKGEPVIMPLTMSLFFRVFGVSDFSVIFTSAFFYVLLVFSTYLLGQKLFGKLTGALSTIAIAANADFLNYATSGASEILFSFLAVISFYLIVLKKRWADILFAVSLILLYLTRPQGIIFIGVLILAWLLVNFKIKKALTIFFSVSIGLIILDKLILYPLSFRYPVYPIVTRGIQALFQYSPSTAVSDALRGGTGTTITLSEVIKKSFYNIYNFYKLLPQIASPYMWGLFVIGLFIWSKTKMQNIFKISSVLIVFGSFLLAALTIPFYRYIHPVIPFMYLIAVSTLVWIASKIFKKEKYTVLASVSLVLFLVIGQTIGVIFLDSRFIKDTHNVGKPPVYVKLSYILRDNTDTDQAVITNLDTWGSWYGERRTIWFPLEPKQLIDPATRKIPFDAIYLTSYLIDDQNYYMGPDWRQIFNNPNDQKKWKCYGCEEIAKEFKIKGVFKVNAIEDYEKQDTTAILLVKTPGEDK